MDVSLRLLADQLDRPVAPSITPTFSFGFAVDGGSGFVENFFPFLRSIPKKYYYDQIIASIEGRILDAGSTGWSSVISFMVFPIGFLLP